MKTLVPMFLLLQLTFLTVRGQQESAPLRADEYLPDSVGLLQYNRLDSAYAALEHRLDSGTATLNKAIDSTYSLIMSPGEYHQQALRLYKKFDAGLLQDTLVIGEANAKLKTRFNSLKAEVHQKKAFLDSLLQTNEFFDQGEMTSHLRLKDPEVPAIPALSDAARIAIQPTALSIPGCDNLPTLHLTEKLPDIDNALRSLQEIADVAGQDIASLNSAIPSQAASIDGILSSAGEGEAISQVIGEAKAIEQKIEATSDLSGAPADLVAAETKRTRKKFVDHLAGQEDKIMDEIKSMEKLQQKYHSVTDVRYLPKRRTNPEKGKPFVERLILGSGLHSDSRDAQWTRIDLAPYAGYKFSDRFRACLGGTYRVSVDMRHLEFSRKDKTFGYSVFGNYHILNGLFAHLEIEALKTNIPPWHLHKAGLTDTEDFTWVPMAYVGITKSYKIARRLRGNTLMLYNFLAASRNFDFNKVTFRFALEFELRKPKVPQGK